MPCNPSLAEAFKYLGLIEKWGSGIGRISHALRESNLPDATYDNNVAGYRSFLRVTMKRLPAQPASKTSPSSELESGLEQAILRELAADPKTTQKVLAEKLAEPVIRIKRTMKRMQEPGLLRREGGRRGGSWIVARTEP